MNSAATVEVGTIVRVDLHGRRVGGWVVELTDDRPRGASRDQLRPIAKVTGAGPSAELIELVGVGVGAVGRRGGSGRSSSRRRPTAP